MLARIVFIAKQTKENTSFTLCKCLSGVKTSQVQIQAVARLYTMTAGTTPIFFFSQ